MATSSLIRRALLYVPSSSKRMLDKSLTLPSVDNITYDLEDSVSPSQKSTARHSLRAFLSSPQSISSTQPSSSGRQIRERAVRINSVDTGLALDDLTTILDFSGSSAAKTNPDAIVIPKVNSASDIHFVDQVITHLESSSSSSSSSPRQPIKLIALIESAQSLTNLTQICTASTRLNGLIFAAEDFALDLSLTRTPSLREFLFARSSIVTAARAHNIPSAIDLVCTSYKGEEGLRTLETECEDGSTMGFNGKQCIHPSQVDVVQRVFAPQRELLQWAARIVVANGKAEEMGKGAWTLDGKMIDRPVVGRAERILERARGCGLDVDGVLEEWRGQEPE